MLRFCHDAWIESHSEVESISDRGGLAKTFSNVYLVVEDRSCTVSAPATDPTAL